MSKRSFVHRYCQTVAGGNKVRCIECAITVITLTITAESTSVTRNHLAFKHPQLYEKVLADETSAKKSEAELVNISSNIRDIKMRLMDVVLFVTVIPHLHDTTGCQTGSTTGLTTGCIM